MTEAGREVAEAISSIFERGSVAGEDGAGFADAIEFFEDFFLQGHAFEDSFDDQIYFAEIVVGERGSDAFEAFITHLAASEAAALDGVCVIRLDGGEAAIERGLIGFFEEHGNSGVGEDHGDAAAHGAGADDGGGFYGDERSFFGDVGNFADFAFAEKNVNQGFGLIGEEALDEKFLFELAAFGEGQCGGGFDGGDGGDGREQAALLFGDSFARGGKNWSVVGGSAEFFVALARFGSGLRGDFAGECDCAGQQIAFDDAINDAELQSFRGFYRISGSAHFDGFCDACQTRKTLRAGCAGNDPEFYFGLANLRAGNGDAIVAGHGDFQATAESSAVNCDDHRLFAVFDFREGMGAGLRRAVCRKSFCQIL